MPVPFGFSVGDCISVCLLIKDTIKALDTVRGSKAEYQVVVGELWALHWALLEVESLQNSVGQGRTKEVTALSASVGACRACLEGFLRRIKKYDESLGANDGKGIAHAWRGMKGKISWALLRKEDLNRFRAEVNAHALTITMLLITANMSLTKLSSENTQDSLEDSRRANMEESNQQLTLLGQVKDGMGALRSTAGRLTDCLIAFMALGSELKVLIRRILTLNFQSYNILLELQTRVPREFEPCWIQEPLILTDSLGRIAPIHLELINSWDVWESVLEARFRNLPGERKIKRKEYALQDRFSQLDIEMSASFESCFLPGRRVDMSMVFRQGSTPTACCPGCGVETCRQNTEAAACGGCGMWFQRVEELVEHVPERAFLEKSPAMAKPKQMSPLTPTQQTRRGPLKSEAMSTKRKFEDAYPDEPMALFKRVRLLHSRHHSSEKTGNTFDEIQHSPTFSFVTKKRNRLFAWLEDQVAWEKIENEEIQRDMPTYLLETQSFLQLAALNGDQEAIRALLSQGENVNAVNAVNAVERSRARPTYRKYPLTALHAAVEGGNKEVVEYLLTCGSDANSSLHFWGTPLIIAVRKHSIEIADVLIRYGANVNQIAAYHRIDALQRASYDGDLAMVDLLLEHGANVNGLSRIFVGLGPAIVAAAANDNVRVIKRLLDDGANVNAVQYYGDKLQSTRRQNALVRAISRGFIPIAHVLLEYGADMHMECECGNALQNAAYFGQEEIFDYLVIRGADPYQQTESFANALEAAVAGGQARMFQKLLALGMDIHFECSGSDNLLQAAALSGENLIVEYLLDRMDVDQRGGAYETALLAASSRGNTATCQLLIDRGAELLIEKDGGGSALHRAVEYSYIDTVKLLLDAGTPIDTIVGKYGTVLQLAALNTSEDIIHLLLERGADVNTQSGYFGNALQAWSYVGNKEIVQFLLDSGADPHAVGGFYETALVAAVHEGRQHIVQLLINYGADVGYRTGSYGTALDHASYLEKQSTDPEEKEVYARIVQRLSNIQSRRASRTSLKRQKNRLIVRDWSPDKIH